MRGVLLSVCGVFLFKFRLMISEIAYLQRQRHCGILSPTKSDVLRLSGRVPDKQKHVVEKVEHSRNALCHRYDWSPGQLRDGIFDASIALGAQYVPMIWGEGDLTEERLRTLASVVSTSPYILGFNEPNFGNQVGEHSLTGCKRKSNSARRGQQRFGQRLRVDRWTPLTCYRGTLQPLLLLKTHRLSADLKSRACRQSCALRGLLVVFIPVERYWGR